MELSIEGDERRRERERVGSFFSLLFLEESCEGMDRWETLGS